MNEKREIKPTDSRDSYLTSIYLLSRYLDHVRAIDIADRRCVSKAAVSMKIRELKKQGFITIESNRISLTSSGKKIAERIDQNYQVFKNFLKNNGIEEKNAEEIASISAGCISSESRETLRRQSSGKPELPGDLSA